MYKVEWGGPDVYTGGSNEESFQRRLQAIIDQFSFNNTEDNLHMSCAHVDAFLDILTYTPQNKVMSVECFRFIHVIFKRRLWIKKTYFERINAILD